jgi:DNA-binding LacI/PurR family transcriptional regulator
MPTPRPSIRDIARRLNVSHVTVSMALRDHPRISATRREQVKKMAGEMGYRPDPMLASLIAYRQDKRAKPIAATLAWINRWPDPKTLRKHSEFNAYWEGAREAADRLGYRVEEFVVSSGIVDSSASSGGELEQFHGRLEQVCRRALWFFGARSEGPHDRQRSDAQR